MGKTSRRPSGSEVRSSTGMQTTWNFYYWDETETNHEGESLRACMDRYGVGGWYSQERDMVAALVYKTAAKTAANSWLLGIKHLNGGKQETARLYEEDPRTYRLSLATTLGAHITSLLAEREFEEV